MTDPSYAAFRRHEKRLAAMAADPELGGDLLLIGIALAREVDLGVKANDEGESTWTGIARRYLLQTARVATTTEEQMLQSARFRLDEALAADRRRYQAPHPAGGCTTILPRAQRRCGRSVRVTAGMVDVQTGEVTYIQSCSDHRYQAESMATMNKRRTEGRIIPLPYANTGGVLERHLPELDWRAWWAKRYTTSHRWQEYPERPHGGPTVTPTLSLLTGEGDHHPDAARATLRLIPGGN